MLAERLGLPPGGAGACSPTSRALGRQGPPRRRRRVTRSRWRCGSLTSLATRRCSPCSAASTSPPRWFASEREARSTRQIAELPRRRRATRSWRSSGDESSWDETLAAEPRPSLTLERRGDRPRAGGDGRLRRSRLAVPGRSLGGSGAARAVAARRCRLEAPEVVAVRRAALVHDLGRVAVPVRIWQKPGRADAGRVGAGQAARVSHRAGPRSLVRSSLALAPIAGAHHERLDGSGYHRGATASTLPLPAAGCSPRPTRTTR